MLKNLLVCLNLKKEIKVIPDLAFNAVEDDMRGGLDQFEISKIMTGVAEVIGETLPSEEDLSAILAILDDDFNGTVSK